MVLTCEDVKSERKIECGIQLNAKKNSNSKFEI